MDIPLIPVGKAKGIMLSKTILEKYNIQDTIELILEKDDIILKPKTKARKGWDKAFKKMHDNDENKLILPDVFKDEDFEEWN